MPALQIFPRQDVEDGPNPEANWGEDLPIADPPLTEDPDDEDNMSIPAAEAPAAGKAQSRNPIQDWSDDDSDDYRVIEALDIPPLSYAYPLASVSAAQANHSRLRQSIHNDPYRLVPSPGSR